ncbi:MAG: hypothetical protein HY608_07495 [Planctomycetes bacterium]|nr:hypothetical protein [Planctomycetota bacterium]
MPSRRGVGIDLGDARSLALEASWTSQGVSIVASHVAEGILPGEEGWEGRLEGFLDRISLRRAPCYFALSGSSAWVRTLRLPPDTRGQEAVLREHVSRVHPDAARESVLDAFPLEEGGIQGASPHLLASAPRALVETLSRAVRARGGWVERVEVAPTALARLGARVGGEALALLDLRADATVLVLLRNDALCGVGVQRHAAPPRAQDLLRFCERHLIHFETRHPLAPVSLVLLCGDAASDAIAGALQMHLGVTASILYPPDLPQGGLPAGVTGAAFAVCCGVLDGIAA